MAKQRTPPTTHPLAGRRVQLITIDELSSIGLDRGVQQTKNSETKSTLIRTRKKKKISKLGRVEEGEGGQKF